MQTQPFEIPMRVGQTTGTTAKLVDLWGALCNAIHPGFGLVVTLALDAGEDIVEPAAPVGQDAASQTTAPSFDDIPPPNEFATKDLNIWDRAAAIARKRRDQAPTDDE